MKLAQTLVHGVPHLLAQSADTGWRRSRDPLRLLDLLRAGRETTLSETKRILDTGVLEASPEAVYGASFGTPSTVRDFYAFEDHVKAGRRSRGLDMDALWYQQPVFYFSNPYATCGAGEVPMTPGSSRFDFEVEIAAILWAGGRNLTPEEAVDRIAGYCIMNDWSGRDVQHEEMRMSMGPVKGKDTATSLGPVFATADEFDDARMGNAFALDTSVSVNGRILSTMNLADIHWSFPELISYASRGTEVRAGDVIGSGTMNGGCLLELRASRGADEHAWLNPGDIVEITTDRLGTLRNTVTEPAPVVPLRSATPQVP